MAEAVVAGALLEFGFGLAFKVAKNTLNITIFCNSRCKKFKETLNTLKPTIDAIYSLSSESASQTWLRSIQDFQAKLGGGLQLVEKCEKTSTLNLLKKFRYAKRMQKLEKDIGGFIVAQVLPNILLSIKALPDHSSQWERLREDIRFIASKIDQHTEENSLQRDELFENSCDADQSEHLFSFSVPNMPHHYLGFDKFLIDLKNLVFDVHVNVVGVTGMGGMGKSTLASALCHDPQVKEYFGNRVLYITVSETPNVENILGSMWDKIVGSPKPYFQNVEDARNKLQTEISSRKNQRTLVVLDDVWSKSKLGKLLFEGDGYKTVVTTRDESTIPKQNETRFYSLLPMPEEHAFSLFCLWAFGQRKIPITHNEELVKHVLKECKGLPLAFKVIGSSLRDQPSPAWESAKKKLSRGQVISEYHKEDLLNRLKTSIDVLDNQAKQCFLDLGAFPGGQKICANALLDIWVYVRGIDWDDAYVILLELAARNLLELKSNHWSSDISYGHTYELYFSQHDLMRDLALHLAVQDNTRLYISQSHSGVPLQWTANRHQESKAQIVSIDTGAMDDQQWSQLEFPETEALVLFLTTSEYSIPFLHTMKKLKVLIIQNYSSQRAKLNGLDASLRLSQLRSLQLERLMLPPLHEYCTALINLEKLSLSLCVGLSNMSEFHGDQCFNFPRLLEIHIDHCSDLEELPMRLCHLNSLEKLSVTNCHLLQNLPDDLGELVSLQELKLSACPSLKTLPQSVCNLGRLEYLDISHCGCLKGFPKGFDELCSLKKLDMRECSRLKNVDHALAKLPCLKRVICDNKKQQHLKSICEGNSMALITVEVVEEPLSLDWLYS